MRVSNLLIMGALSALVFTGCTNNDDNSEWLDSNSVTFNSRIDGLQTKASKDVWSNGDEVGIFMTTQTAEFANKKYVASDGGTLTAAPGQTLRYPEEGTASFIAYYPYSASLNGKTLAMSVDNQADPAKVDLLYSDNAKAIAAGEAVDLAFKHKLSQIVIAVGSDETLPDISGLKISLSGMNTQADFNLADGTLAAKESKANIDMNVSADGTTAEAIILPTTTLDGAQLKIMLDNLNLQERAMTEMFSGTLKEEPQTFTIRLTPKEMNNEVAFRFSKRLGIVANDDLAGEPCRYYGRSKH